MQPNRVSFINQKVYCAPGRTTVLMRDRAWPDPRWVKEGLREREKDDTE
jgi:hypothetical protein